MRRATDQLSSTHLAHCLKGGLNTDRIPHDFCGRLLEALARGEGGVLCDWTSRRP